MCEELKIKNIKLWHLNNTLYSINKFCNLIFRMVIITVLIGYLNTNTEVFKDILFTIIFYFSATFYLLYPEVNKILDYYIYD